MPEWSKGVDSSSTSASCVGSNPTAVNFQLQLLRIPQKMPRSQQLGRQCSNATRVARTSKTGCPSGLRGWTQVPLAQAAWVKIPQLSIAFVSRADARGRQAGNRAPQDRPPHSLGLVSCQMLPKCLAKAGAGTSNLHVPDGPCVPMLVKCACASADTALQDTLPEWSKGVDSSSTSASSVASNPTAVN